MTLRILFAALVLSLCTSASQARIVQIIGYDELFDKSDLIVIAHPASKTSDTRERTYFSGVAQMESSGRQSRVPAIGVETTFDIIKILKGHADGKQFVLHHFREPSLESLNGPITVSFDPSDPKRDGDVLLFLVREKDGRFAPYGGQTDPGFRSIQALNPPS
jgi:hypothetical protein